MGTVRYRAIGTGSGTSCNPNDLEEDSENKSENVIKPFKTKVKFFSLRKITGSYYKSSILELDKQDVPYSKFQGHLPPHRLFFKEY